MSLYSMSWHRRKAGDRRCVRVEVVLRNVVFFSSSASKWQTDRFCFAELKRRKKWNWNCFYLSVVFPPFFAKVKREKVICATKKKTILFVTKIIWKSSPGTDVIKLFIFQSTCELEFIHDKHFEPSIISGSKEYLCCCPNLGNCDIDFFILCHHFCIQNFRNSKESEMFLQFSKTAKWMSEIMKVKEAGWNCCFKASNVIKFC